MLHGFFFFFPSWGFCEHWFCRTPVTGSCVPFRRVEGHTHNKTRVLLYESQFSSL